MPVFPPIFLNNYKDYLENNKEYRLIDTSYRYSLFIKLLEFEPVLGKSHYNSQSLKIKYLNLCNNKTYSKQIFGCYSFFIGLNEFDNLVINDIVKAKYSCQEGDFFYAILYRKFLEINLEKFVKSSIFTLAEIKNSGEMIFKNIFSSEEKKVTDLQSFKRRWIKLDRESINWVNLLVI